MRRRPAARNRNDNRQGRAMVAKTPPFTHPRGSTKISVGDGSARCGDTMIARHWLGEVRMARTLGQVRRAPLVLWLAVASIAVGACAWMAFLRSRAAMSPCESEMRHGSMQQAIATCRESYQRTGNEQDLDWAAAAGLQIRELDQAEQLASQLLHGRFFGDAHQILGSVSVYRDRTADAWTHARIAFATHQLAGDDKRVARDAMLLSNIALKQGDY